MADKIKTQKSLGEKIGCDHGENCRAQWVDRRDPKYIGCRKIDGYDNRVVVCVSCEASRRLRA